MSAWTSHVTLQLLCSLQNPPSVHAWSIPHCLPQPRIHNYASTEVSPHARTCLCYFTTHILWKHASHTFSTNQRAVPRIPKRLQHRSMEIPASRVFLMISTNQRASRVSPHAPRSLGQPMMARQTGHVTSRAGRNDGPTTMPSFCSTISSGTSKPMLR